MRDKGTRQHPQIFCIVSESMPATYSSTDWGEKRKGDWCSGDNFLPVPKTGMKIYLWRKNNNLKADDCLTANLSSLWARRHIENSLSLSPWRREVGQESRPNIYFWCAGRGSSLMCLTAAPQQHFLGQVPLYPKEELSTINYVATEHACRDTGNNQRKNCVRSHQVSMDHKTRWHHREWGDMHVWVARKGIPASKNKQNVREVLEEVSWEVQVQRPWGAGFWKQTQVSWQHLVALVWGCYDSSWWFRL